MHPVIVRHRFLDVRLTYHRSRPILAQRERDVRGDRVSTDDALHVVAPLWPVQHALRLAVQELIPLLDHTLVVVCNFRSREDPCEGDARRIRCSRDARVLGYAPVDKPGGEVRLGFLGQYQCQYQCRYENRRRATHVAHVQL